MHDGYFDILYMLCFNICFYYYLRPQQVSVNPVDSISSSQTCMSLSERIQDALALLRYHRLSPCMQDARNFSRGTSGSVLPFQGRGV